MSSAKGAETSYKNRRNCAWVKPPTAAHQVTWNITAHPGAHQRSYRSYNGVGMVCKVSVKNHFDDRLISMTDFSKIIMI